MVFKKIIFFIKYISALLLVSIAYGSLLLPALFFFNFWWSLAIGLFFSSWVMYPIIYPFRKLIRNNKHLWLVRFFWYYLDDEDGECGPDIATDGKECTFLKKWLWSANRNPWWNGQAKLVIGGGERFKKTYKSNLKQDGKEVSYFKMAVIKTVNALGQYKDNFGEFISLKYSIVNDCSLWFTKENSSALYWRYSNVYRVKSGLWFKIAKLYYQKIKGIKDPFSNGYQYWREIQLGITYKEREHERNKERYTLRIKHKRAKVYEEFAKHSTDVKPITAYELSKY